MEKSKTQKQLILKVCFVLQFCVCCAVPCVCFCTSQFYMVPLDFTCLHCLQHFLFEHLFYNVYINIIICMIKQNKSDIICNKVSKVQTRPVPRVRASQVSRVRASQVSKVQTRPVPRVRASQVSRVRASQVSKVQARPVPGVHISGMSTVVSEFESGLGHRYLYELGDTWT